MREGIFNYGRGFSDEPVVQEVFLDSGILEGTNVEHHQTPENLEIAIGLVDGGAFLLGLPSLLLV